MTIAVVEEFKFYHYSPPFISGASLNDDDREHVKIIHTLDMAECARLTEAREKPLPGLFDWQRTLADRAIDWACWHADRGRDRFIENESLDWLIDALENLKRLPLDAADATRNAAVAEAHKALIETKAEAEANALPGAGRDQCAEIDQGDVGYLILDWERLEELRRLASDGCISREEAFQRAADCLCHSPGAPPIETAG